MVFVLISLQLHITATYLIFLHKLYLETHIVEFELRLEKPCLYFIFHYIWERTFLTFSTFTVYEGIYELISLFMFYSNFSKFFKIDLPLMDKVF